MIGQRNLYFRLGLSTLIVVLIPLLILGVGVLVLVSDSLNITAKQKNLDLVNSIGRELNLMLINAEKQMLQIDSVINLSLLKNKDFQAYLDIMVDHTEMVEMIQILDSSNQIELLSPKDYSLLGNDQSGQSFIKKSWETEDYSWSKTFISPDTGEPTVAMSRHFEDYTIVFYLDLNKLTPLIEDKHRGELGYAFILDSEGIVIGHYDKNLVLRRENMRNNGYVRKIIDSPSITNLSGEDKNEILTLISIKPTSWIIGYRQKWSIAFSQVIYIRNIIILGSFLTLSIAMMFSFFNIRATVAPLKELLKATQDVTRGEYQFVIEPGKISEVSQLADQFKIMVNAIENREIELSRLRNYLSYTINAMPSLIIGVDNQKRVYLWNSKAEEQTGRTFDEVQGILVDELLFDKSYIMEEISNSLKKNEIFEAKKIPSQRGKEKVYEDIFIYPLINEEGCVLGAVIRIDDVTQKIYLEKRASQQERLSSIGEMAAGMAHDMNNLLTPILGFNELIMMEVKQQPQILSYGEQIEQAANQAQDMIGQLLSFSRQLPHQPHIMDLNEVLRGFQKLLRRTIREDITIELVPDSKPIMIKVDKGQIEQIIMNLSINAQFAMPDGGKLIFETGVSLLDDEYMKSHPGVKTGYYGSLIISDTGTGMDEEVQNQIFDPFFSTKGEMGTGLGLTTVYGIVKKHGGHIWLYSELNRGTTFKIYFPLTDQSENALPFLQQEREIPLGSEHVLLAEDNKQVSDLAEEVLRKNGYRVSTASNGKEALEKFREMLARNEPPDILLADVIMPELNGKDLFDKIQSLLPSAKVIFMSGYTDNLLSLEEGKWNFLQKPFTVRTLSNKVREVLDGKAE